MIAERVIAVVATASRVPAERIRPETKLAELGIDSFRGLNLITDLENAFDVFIANPFGMKLETVGDLVAGVEKLVADAAREKEGSHVPG
jgi:acyl carrier protein